MESLLLRIETAWLKTLFLNRHRSRQRQRGPIVIESNGTEPAAELADPLADAEYERYLIRQAFRLIECEFSTLHQMVFRAYVIEERDPEEVARQLGVSPGTVYAIKSKVLSRLRQELKHLVD